jgi:hypothetical protein
MNGRAIDGPAGTPVLFAVSDDMPVRGSERMKGIH